MIKVIYARGCYGNYLTRCLYHYSNLRQETFVPLTFDQAGSSHVHRTNNHARSVIVDQHIESLKPQPHDQLIVLAPDSNHWLDYFDNHLVKNAKGDWISYLCDLFDRHSVQNVLKKQWAVDAPLEEVPKWIMREWCSYWLKDLWHKNYDFATYQNTKSVMTANVEQMLDDYVSHIKTMIERLDLTLTVDPVIIASTHERFLLLQRFRGIQKQCIAWTEAVVQGIHGLACPAQTLFDEAYIQSAFRDRGYELRCNLLDDFPRTSTQMKELVYTV